jgi:hypothetical protein
MHDIKALFGTPGEAVPRVKADDLKKLWTMGQDLNSRNPGKQSVMGAGMLEMACSPGADTRAVWFRGARLGMLNMLLKNPLSGRVGRHLQGIAFAVFAKIPMKWWEVGVPRRTLF